MERIKNEPALVSGFVAAVLGLVMAFGLDLSTQQVVGIESLVIAVLAFVTRQLVVPVNKVLPVA